LVEQRTAVHPLVARRPASQRVRRAARFVLEGRFDHLLYAMWVRWKGLDFRPVSLEQLGLSESRSVYHAASGGVFLADLLRRIEIARGSRALDLGCGKGSAVCTLARFSFDEVVGVDLSEELVRIAESNSRKLGLGQVRFCVSDAGAFTDLDRFTHIYMFNPFPAPVMREVMKNLTESLRRRPRSLTLIYFFPVCHDVVAGSGLFAQVSEIECGDVHPYNVYRHEAEGDRRAVSR
jgi:SAM-dependent methyltransferase